jgi:histidinol phosphatase-like enzyme
MVGDRESDMEFAKKLGFRAVQLSSEKKNSPSSDYCTDTLDDAANWILSIVDGKEK